MGLDDILGAVVRAAEHAAANPRRPEVAGPYRSQSSVRSIRRQAAPQEHRHVANPFDAFGHAAPAPAGGPLAIPSLTHLAPPLVNPLAGITPSLAGHGAVDYSGSPYTALKAAALHGVEPAVQYQHEWPRGFYAQIAKVARDKVNSGDNISADPIAEGIISAVPTLGLGAAADAGASLLRGGTEAALGAAGADAAASGGSGAADVLKGLRTVQAVKAAPQALHDLPANTLERLARVADAAKNAPAAARALPAAARGAVTEFPSAALDALKGAPGAIAERGAGAIYDAAGLPGAIRQEAAGLGSAEGQRLAAARAIRAGEGGLLSHPVLGGAAILGGAHRAGIEVPLAKQADAFLTGNAAALLHPTKTLPTTARALAGTFAAPFALGYSGAQSAVELDPSAFDNTVSSQWQGLFGGGSPATATSPAVEPGIFPQLLSGNEKTVQKAVENNVGLAFLAPGPAISRLPLYDRLLGAARDSAKEYRGAVNDRAPSGSPLRYGPEEQNVFGFTEHRAQRRQEAVRAQRAYGPHTLESTHHANALLRTARKTKDARKMTTQDLGPSDIVSTLAELGATKEAALHHLQLLRDHGPVGEVPRHGDVTLRSIVDAVDKNPQWLQDPHLWKQVEQYRESTKSLPSAAVGGGERASRLLQARIFGIKPPELVTPFEARKFTGELDREAAWKDLEAQESRAKDLRHAGRIEAVRAAESRRLGDHEEGAVAKAHSEHLYSQAHVVEEHTAGFRKALEPYSRPGAAIVSSAKRDHWDPQSLQEFNQKVDAAAGKEGMQVPVITHHTPLRQEGEVVGHGGNEATRVQHIRSAGADSLAERDAVDRGFRAMIEGSVVGPHMRAAGKDYTRETFADATPIKVDGKDTIDVTHEQFSQAVRDGQISEEHYRWHPNRLYKAAFDDPFQAPADLAELADRRGSAASFKPAEKGELGRVLPMERSKEFLAQTNPARSAYGHVIEAAGRTATKSLLFSPAWVISQVFAEGFPILAANPRLLNPAYVHALRQRLKYQAEASPQEARAFAAMMGESRMPIGRAHSDYQPNAPMTRTHQMAFDAARAIERTPLGRGLFSVARQRPFGIFDAWRHGEFNKVLAAAELDRSLNKWLGGTRGMLHVEKLLSDELRHLSPEDQLVAINHPRYKPALDALAGYVEDVTGNWSAFSRFERKFAPALAFYGFIRYAFRWPLTFAKQHPAAATVNYFLAQQNANQVRKVLGEAPASFLQYADPVIHGPHDEKSLLPIGSRITPGLSGPSQGFIEGNAPSAVVGSLNPLLGALVGAVTGTNAFGQHDEGSGPLGLDLSLAGRELLAVPPVFRLFNVGSVVGLGQSESPTAQELRKLDPQRSLRSAVLPTLPLSGDAARKSNEIISALGSGSGGSTSTNPFDGFGSTSSSNPFDSFGSSSSTNPFDSFGTP